MNLVFIIKNRDNTPFMVVSTTPKGSTFKPMTEDAKELVGILRQEYADTPITKPELVQSMDASKIIEGPSPSGTAVQKKVASLTKIQSEPIELKNLPVLSISEVLLSEFSDAEFKNVLTFKASSFISDQTRSSAHFEIKGVRAVWDPSLSIPGTNRRGGFRCPVGTRYGGQITDRFGRSCGWGVARRIANQIADIGERLEQRDDDKRKRRLDRRNARMMRRLGGVAETGRLEGGLRGIADRLDGGDAPKPRVGRGAVAETDGIDGGWRNVARGLVGQRRVPNRQASPEIEAPSARAPRNRRRDVIPETAPTPAPKPRPARRPAPAGQRRPQPRPRVAPQPANVDVLTARDASDAGETEDFKPYVLRKYNEYAKRVREIRAGGGNAGMLTRREWYEINKNNLRDAWKDAHGRTAPLDFEPPAPRNRRPQNNRRRRRQATAQDAGRSATRKPTANDVPEPAPARPARPARRPRRSPDGRGFVTPGDGGAPAQAFNVSPIKLGSKWKKNRDGSWERDGYKLTMTVGRDGAIERMVIEAPDGGKNEMLYGGGRGTETLNNAVDTFLRTAKQLAEGRRAQNPQVNLNPNWTRRNDGTWERNGYEIEAFYDANGKLDKFVLKDPDGNSYEQGYRGRHTDTDINDAAENLYAVAGGPEVDMSMLGGDSETPEPPTPRTPPRAPTRQRGGNNQQLKMNNLVDNHYTELPKLQPDDGKFVAVRVGNKGINTLADAKRYRGSLADIPDEFLLGVIQSRTHKKEGAISPNVVEAVRSVYPNSTDAEVAFIMRRLSDNLRKSLNDAPPALDQETKDLIKALKDKNVEFVQVAASSGITSPQYFFHLSDDPTKWGRGYFLKKPDRGWESNQGNGKKISQHAELIGNILAKQIGFANGAPRLVKGSNNNPFLLMDIFVNNAEGKVAGRYSPGNVTDAKSRFFNGALNAIMNVADRHNGNGDQIKGNGAIPLDFGRALFGRKSASGQMQYLSRLMMDQASWGGYTKRLNGKVGAARTREVNAIRAELQADIALAAENMRVGLRRVNEMNQAYDALDIDAKDDRMADLVYNIDQFASPEYLDLLMQKITT
jgi:hypothetical protein